MNVYENELRENIIATTKQNNNCLDLWDGNNYCRGTGVHMGLHQITKGKYKDRYILIYTSQWQGTKSWSHLITNERALQEWLEGGQPDGFPDLEKIANEMEV